MFQKTRLIFILAATHFLVSASSIQALSFEVGEGLPRAPLTEAEILLDHEDRLSDDFSVPPALIPRVGFWFDIYTKYSSQQKVIHHQDFPWWIVEVVDTTDILALPARAQWLNNVKADKHVHMRLASAKTFFRGLSKKLKKNQELTPEETTWVEKAQLLPGDLKKNIAAIPERLRIQTGQKDFYMAGLQRSTRYLEFMEKIFVERGLPAELTRLPLVESSFNENAGSKVGALGIWQLMPSISTKFLTVSNLIDERRSPYKATYVAARLFQENYKILNGAWPLVVTAYNHGPGGMYNAVKKLGTDDFATIIEKHKSPSFGFASSNFYCSFLAALLAEAYSHEIFGDMVNKDFAHIDRMTLPRKIRIRDLMNLSQLDEDEFLSFNPDLKKAAKINAALPRGFTVYLPVTKVSVVIESLNKSLRIAQK